MLDSDSDSEWNESEEFDSDQELTTDESSYAEYETWSYNKEKHVGYAGSSGPAGYVKPT